MKKQSLLLAFSLAAAAAAAAYEPPAPPPFARALTPEQVERIVDAASPDATVRVPAWFVREMPSRRAVATNLLAIAAVRSLAPVVADTRSNIVEVASLTDVEIAALYLEQMRKPHGELVADAVRLGLPTNTLEYLVGAGMRSDLGAGRGD